MKDRASVLIEIKEKFKADIIEIIDRSAKRVYFEIRPDSLVPVASFVFKNLGARFNIASGVDVRNHLEILYHFTLDEIDLVLSLRVKLDKNSKLEIETLTSVFKGADWIEREIHEMFGINFKGHPDLRKLLLPDDWPEGVYPLRRDYKEWDEGAIRDRGV